jgi:predicted chitinase
MADDAKRWQDMNPDEQAVVIRQINGAVNGLQFRVQDIEDAVKALQERLKR